MLTESRKNSSVPSIALPVPRCPITVRPGTIDDLPFIDRLQKMHTKQVGWMPTKQLEGKIRLQQCLIAEAVGRESEVGSNHPQPTTHDPRRRKSAT